MNETRTIISSREETRPSRVYSIDASRRILGKKGDDMKLYEAIIKIGYDDSWGIWAEVPFSPEGEARIGQRIFENGGLLDEKVFFATGTECGDFLAEHCPPDEERESDYIYECVEVLIDQIEQERLEYLE